MSLRRSVQPDLQAGTLVELDVDMDPMYLVLHCAIHLTALQAEVNELVELVRRQERQVQPVVSAA